MAPESIAARFGQSVITVRQRLKLPGLAPKVLDVLREDAMSIEQARALAISDSHEEQERASAATSAADHDGLPLLSALTPRRTKSGAIPWRCGEKNRRTHTFLGCMDICGDYAKIG
ncbi:hypothetical protein GCM10010520_23030 [Rhizobium viscosum]|uniref:ParB-like chromosome segregation protein Spo0J n=1 Tax=Rhizobium viscosum TaxID=1673 RepID=A0ABR9IJD0_RHIVS|nr:ParB-like chromosome segregation protein Spo0J [Rhizobium viscosum]